jgi:nicotinamide mononucleotide transporter
MSNALEIAANAVMALSIWLAARNSVHTWSTGIVGCLMFVFVFLRSQLYADATLQLFFIATSLAGWWHWLHSESPKSLDERPITKARASTLFVWVLGAR